MAQREIKSNSILLFIGTDGVTYETVVCLTNNGITRATASIESNTKCGPNKSPGSQTNEITFEGQGQVDPDSGKTSVDQLDDYWRNITTIYWKMGPAVPELGDVTYYGTGFVAKLDESFAVDANATFSGSISPYGTINKTTATS